MKSIKTFIAGILIGATAATAVTAFAASEQVTAYLTDVSFRFGSIFKDPPSDEPALMYNNRTYVPARFVAENIGATVDWSETSRIVTFTPPEPVIEEKIVYVEIEKEDTGYTPDGTTSTYLDLPISRISSNAELTIKNYLIEENEVTRVYYKIVNTNLTFPLRFKFSELVLIADGVEYLATDVQDSKKSPDIFTDLQPDTERETYFTFPSIPDTAKYATLKVTVAKNDGREEVPENFEFNFKLSK